VNVRHESEFANSGVEMRAQGGRDVGLSRRSHSRHLSVLLVHGRALSRPPWGQQNVGDL